MNSPAELEDADSRRRIATELDATLFVEAGAGSGKTTALVERVSALVGEGIPIETIAAITFTEKAAAELRARLRQRLSDRAQEGSPAERALYAQALSSLDQAAIGTIHAFARRILTRHPLEAGLPPTIEVLDEISSQLAFDERWRDELEALLAAGEHDRNLADALLLAHVADVKASQLRDLARALGRDIDRLGRWIPDDPPPVGELVVDDIIRGAEEVAAMRTRTEAAFPDDKLVLKLIDIEAWAATLRSADRYRRLTVLGKLPTLGALGKGELWRGPTKDEVKAAWASLDTIITDRLAAVKDACLLHLAVVLGHYELRAAEERRTSGRLQFDDLLILARAVLRDPVNGARVRRENHEQYQRILLDEFQDTDAIQLEIALLIAGDPDDEAADWQTRQPSPGRLFMVGDPKQSIYRFRGADIATFLGARDLLADEPLQLTSNFRTTSPVIDWVNATFTHLLHDKPGAQAGFVPLAAVRPSASVGPAVVTFGGGHPAKTAADAIRVAEAADIASLIIESADWTVEREYPDGKRWERRRLSDITILMPTRLSLPAVEEALDDAGIGFRAETSSLIFATREVRDLLLAARAVDDASDEVALVSALRTPLFGCSDVELAQWRHERDGRWNLAATNLPERLPGPDGTDFVYDAIIELRELHHARLWLTPAEVLDRLASRRFAFELGTLTSRNRDVWRRLRFVIDQARAWSDAGGRTLRSFLAWCNRQGAEGAHLSPAVLPETDDDAVRIMTVHAAKGLEFPIVILAGLSTRRRAGGAGVSVRWFDGKPEIRLRPELATSLYDPAAQFDDQMDNEERFRLLYVACTRARDHLAVSLHTAGRASGTGRTKPVPETNYTNAEVLSHAIADTAGAPLHETFESGAGSPVALDLGAGSSASTLAQLSFDPATWARDHALMLDRASRRTSLSPSGLADLVIDHDDETRDLGEVDPGLVKDARPLDLPPWNRGRYGTAIGRAVHGTLQHVVLKTGAGITDIAAAQAAAEGLPGAAETVERLALSALEAPSIKEAARSDHWRELFVGTTVGDRVLEGYIDLLYRTDAGYVVVDYKTDRVTADSIDDRVDHYRLQGAAYALAVEAILGEPVLACRFVFCREDGAIERELPDLRGAIDAARAAMTS